MNSSLRSSRSREAFKKIARLEVAEVSFHVLKAFAALSTALMASASFTHDTLYCLIYVCQWMLVWERKMTKHQKISGMRIVQVVSLSELLEGSVVQDGWDSSV